MGLDSDAKVKFRGPQYRQTFLRLNNGYHTALIGPPGPGKTMCGKMSVMRYCGLDPESMTHEEFDRRWREGVANREWEIVVGRWTLEPEDVIGAFVKSSELRCGDCSWETVVYEGQEFEQCPECGSPAIQKTDVPLRWRHGALARAMIHGRPFFWNEFTRSPRRTQEVLIAPTADGHLSVDQIGETILAEDGFVVVTDMNTEEHDRDVEMFGWAMGSRLRKIHFPHPDEDLVRKILRDRLESPSLIDPIVKVFNKVSEMESSGHVSRPIVPRGLLSWADDISLELDNGSEPAEAFARAAELTWLHDVVGSDDRKRSRVKSHIQEVASGLTFEDGRMVDIEKMEMDRVYRLLHHDLGIDRLPKGGVQALCREHAIQDFSQLWNLRDRGSVTSQGVPKIGGTLMRKIWVALDGSTTQGRDQSMPDKPLDDVPEYELYTVVEHALERDLWEKQKNQLQSRGLRTWDDVRTALSESRIDEDSPGVVGQLAEWCNDNFDKLENLAHSDVLL